MKNKFLLRILLLFGMYWMFKFVFEFISAIGGWFLWKTNWLAIIGGATLAIVFHKRVFRSTSDLIIESRRMPGSTYFLLRLLVGYGIYISIIKCIGLLYYDRFGFWHSLSSVSALDKMKTFAFIISALYLAYHFSRIVVSPIGYDYLAKSNFLEAQVSATLEVPPVVSEFREKNDKYTAHGSAYFSDFTLFNPKHNKISNDEMIKRFDENSGFVVYPQTHRLWGHEHAVVIGAAGTGKGTMSSINNALSIPNESLVTLDIKGETASICAAFHRRYQRVFILDPFDVQQSIKASHGIKPSGFNPLVIAKYLQHDELIDFAAMVAEMFIPQGSKDGSDAFFSDRGRTLLKVYILHLMTGEDITERHLGKLYEWLRLKPEEQVALWVDMEYNEYTKYSINQFSSVAIDAPQTWGGILSNAQRATEFLDSPIIRKSLSSDDFDPMLLQTSRATVFVVLPERHLDTHKVWLRLVFGSLLKLCNYVAQSRVNFLIDEFPILGRMDDFKRAFSFGRGQGINCWLYAQSLSQIKGIYGEEGLNEFMSCARVKLFFGVQDLFTRTYVSDYLGVATEIFQTKNSSSSAGSSTSFSTNDRQDGVSSSNAGSNENRSNGNSEQIIQRKLMSPDEVGDLYGRAVLIVENSKYLVPLVPYYEVFDFMGRYDPNPYYKG